SSKFCNGEERGTIFDGILLFLVFEGETKVYPLAFLVFENDFELKEKAEELIPGIELKEYPRANQSPAQENNKSAKNEDEESAKSYVVFLDIEED
ncbi:type II restriction-modification system endonuclease YdiR, partial [Escherichia coli]|nr:type II restriction-modification system endonuclease YdiR [Escherichia coli]